jgi:hypothetical protein
MEDSMIDSQTIEMLSGLAERLHKAGVFGQEVTSADKAFAVLLKGHELGFTPMAAAGSIAIIKGKVSLSADATIALCKRSPACLYLRLVESSEEVATYETQRHGDPSPTALSYTIAQAKTAGLTGSQTWRAHAPAMLRARCGAAIARAVYPDLVAGIYDPDEVAEIVRSEPAPARVEVPDVSLAALESWRSTLDDVASLRDMHAAWTLAAPSLHAAGRADHGRTLASERLTALGYALTLAEVQSVLSGAIDPPLASALDAIADITRHADDEDGDGVVADAVRVLRGIATAATHSKVTAFRAAIKRASALGVPDAKARLTSALTPPAPAAEA